MESEIKKNLSDLSQIPQKEFEKHFSEWMARDDVARSLQAKLRMDLIKNFNQTHLGKQILSQTTSTTGYGASAQRLTLSPLILALNTLVAEFLYAQNCHFSLSVFCTEIPFRNTLPDFESSRCFRFTEAEVLDIFEAISSGAKFEKDFKNTICREYAANANSSLLLLVLKNLLTVKQQPTTAIKGTSFETEPPPPPPPTKTWDESIQTDLQPSFKATTSDRNFLHLNKYLIILSRKVKEMTQQFEQLQQRGEPNWPPKTMPRPRNLKCKRQRKYENLNRSLERIVENLNRMAHSKRKSKRVAAILTAIEAMSKQFEKCSSSFEQVSKVLVNQDMVKPKAEIILKAVPTQATQTAEKSYIEWVHEMRTTKNGEQFLRKVELSLGKALKKQKQQLDQETEVKLRHQKELLNIRYKQKLLEKWQKFDTRESAVDARNNNRYESIEKKLKQFEVRHYDLLDKIRYAEQFGEQQQQSAMRNKMRSKPETTVEPPEAAKDNKTEVLKTARNCQSDESLRRGDSYQQKTLQSRNSKDVDSKLQNMKKSVSEGEFNVDHIVCDAKMRIRELELESNQLEQSFRNYLERQRLQKEASKRAAETMWNNYAIEKNKIENQFQLAKQRMRNQFRGRQRRRRRSLESSNEGEGEDSEECFNRQLRGLNVERLRGASKKVVAHQSSESSNTIVFTNAIQEAKSKLFHDQTLKLKKSTNYKDSVLSEVNSNLSIYSKPRLPLDVNISRRSPEPQLPLAALNLTVSEVQLQPQGLKRKTEFNFSSTDSDSDTMQATKQAAAMVFGRSRQLNEMTEQQLGISSATTTTTTTSTMSIGQSKAKKALNFDSAVDVRKGNKRDQHPFDSGKEGQQQQQLRMATDSTTTLIKVAEPYQQKCEETETNSKLLPTSLVLQQSMAKMNKLFGEQQELSTRVKALEVKTREQEDNNTATNQSKETTSRTTTSVATTLRHRFNDDHVGDTAATVASAASSLHADGDDAVLSNIGDGVTTLAAARTITTTKQLNTSADKTEKKNFNAIEKNNHPTRTVIETVASLQQAETEEEKEKEATTRATTTTTTEKEIPLQSNTITENLLEGAIKSKQNTLRSENNCNEAQVFNVDNQRIGNDNNRDQKKQEEKQKEDEEWEERKLHQEKIRKHTFKDQELNFTTSTESSVTDEEQQHQKQQQRPQQQQEAEEQQVVEFGEIIDSLNVDTAFAAIATFADDNAAIVIQSSSDSTTASSFELEQKAANSSSSDFWE